jgi:hypothetical protein
MLIFNERHLRMVLTNYVGTTTVDDPTAPANFTHHGQVTPWRTSARNGSNVARFWAA